MRDKILVSICIPAYNAARFIKETLDSVMKQTYRNWEVVVVEDGSMDGTEEIVSEFSNQVVQNVVYFRNEKNLGLPATRNIASSKTSGDWIAYLDSDDLWHPDHLTNLIHTAKNCGNCDLIHSGVNLFDGKTGQVISERIPTIEAVRKFPVSLFDRSYPIQPSSIIVSRELYHKTGGFNESFRYVEDLEMWFRCAKMGFKFAFSDKNTCYYRIHPQAMTTHSMELAYGAAKAYELYADWEAIPKKIRIKFASEHWLGVARFARKKNAVLAMRYLKNSMRYSFNFQHVFYWILISTTLFQQKSFSN